MAIRAERILADADTTNLGDLFGHLGPRQHAALTGFCALAELDLEHLHLRVRRDLADLVVVEIAVEVTYPVLRRADLKDDVAAAVEVIRRQATFAGIHPATGLVGAARQREHRRLGYGAVAHAGNVEQRSRCIGRATTGADGYRPGRHGIFTQGGERAVHEHHGAGLAQIAGRTESDRVVDILGGAIHPASLRAVEGQLFAIHGEEVLAEEFSQVLEKVAKPPDDRIVASYRMTRLGYIQNVGNDYPENDRAEDHQERGGKQFQAGDQEIAEAFRHTLHSESKTEVVVISRGAAAVPFGRCAPGLMT